MKKTLRSILAGALALLAVSCYDDSALKSAIASLESRVTELENKLNTDVSTINSKIDGLEAAYKLADTGLSTSIANLTSALDALDGSVDGLISDKTNLLAAIEELKTADKNLADKDTELLASLVGVGVSNVAKNAAGNVVITFVDGNTLEIPAKPETGIVTVVEVEGEKYWAVVVNGETKSLDVKVGHPSLEFEVDPETNELLYSVDGGEFEGTGAYVADDQESLLTDLYQEIVGMDYTTYEPIMSDYFILVFGGVEYKLPVYQVDNSVAVIKNGNTRFEYGQSMEFEVAFADVTTMYVMAKPDGWKAKLAENKLTVTAPAEANVDAGLADADGEVLLHCTTKTGTCKIAKLSVYTSAMSFEMTVFEGAIKIVNSEVVTRTNRLGEEITDFNDAYVGLAPLAAFEADPENYVSNIADNRDDTWTMISNWKNNTMDEDEEGNPVYKIGGAYKPGVYEVDVIESTVADLYADLHYGNPLPKGSFVVWACPTDENGMPRLEDLCYSYYYPVVKAVAAPVENGVTATDVEFAVTVKGADHYYVGAVTESMMYGLDVDKYMKNQEGPFGYFQMALAYGMPDYAFQQMGQEFGGENGAEMPEKLKLSDLVWSKPTPNEKAYVWVFPVVEGIELADYTYEKNMKPYIYEMATSPVAPGSTVTVEISDEKETITSLEASLTGSEGTAMLYYKWYTEDEYNSFDDDAAFAADITAKGKLYVSDSGDAFMEVNPGEVYVLAAVAVDATGKYGAPAYKFLTAPEIVYSDTFVAEFGEESIDVTGWWPEYNWSVTVTGGEAKMYYYYCGTKELTDAELAKLPMESVANREFTSSNKCSTLYLDEFDKTCYFAVVVESAEGVYSKPIKKTVVVPAQPADEEQDEQ